eukprot:s2854_g3.t1
MRGSLDRRQSQQRSWVLYIVFLDQCLKRLSEGEEVIRGSCQSPAKRLCSKVSSKESFEEPANVTEDLDAIPGSPPRCPAPTTPPSSEVVDCKPPAKRLCSKVSSAEAALPPCLKRRSGEGWSSFYARCRKQEDTQHGTPPQSQSNYRKQWQALTPAQQNAFTEKHAGRKVCPEVPEVRPSQTSYVTIPTGYDMKALKSEFAAISKNHQAIAGNDDLRWLLYSKVALLLKQGVFSNATQAAAACEDLHVTRQKLARVVAFLEHGPLPLECPPDFKMGASPHKALTLSERMDLPEMIRWHSSCAMPMAVSD